MEDYEASIDGDEVLITSNSMNPYFISVEWQPLEESIVNEWVGIRWQDYEHKFGGTK
jgi:hypothetical protein